MSSIIRGSFPKTWIEKAKYGFILFLFTTLLFFIDFSVTLLRSNVVTDMKVSTYFFYIPTALGHAAILALILFVFYLLLITIVKHYKISGAIYITLSVVAQMLIVLDGLVFNLYRFHINGFVVDLVFGAGSQVFVFDLGVLLKFILLVVLVSILPYVIAAIFASKNFSRVKGRMVGWFCGILILCVVVGQLGSAYASAARKAHMLRSGTVIPWFYPLRANTLFERLGLLVTDEIDNVSYNIESSDINYPLHPLNVDDSIPRYNIMHILIDSWNPTAYDSIITPNIYKFAQKGNFFSQHLSSNDATSGSIFGMFFGISNTYDKDFEIAQRTPIFIDQLVNNGYNIQVFPSATFRRPPFDKRIFRRAPHINTDTEGNSAFERDNKLTDMTLDFLAKQNAENPFYSLLFYDLPHAISIPEEYRNKFQPSWDEPDYLKLTNDTDRTGFFNLYKNCVYHVDSLIGRVINDLTDRKMLENTVIIITGDHGQEFNENKKNYWGHGSNYSNWQLEVPFILYYPDIEGGLELEHMTTHYDITPTLMSRFFGVRNTPSDYSMGYDMMDTTNRYPHIVGNHIRFGFVFEDIIVSTGFVGEISITDRSLNEIPRNKLKASALQKAIDQMNVFYKK